MAITRSLCCRQIPWTPLRGEDAPLGCRALVGELPGLTSPCHCAKFGRPLTFTEREIHDQAERIDVDDHATDHEHQAPHQPVGGLRA